MSELISKNMVTADLEKPLKRKNVGIVMANGDENANRFCVRVERGGVDVDLTGHTVKGFLILPSDETMEIDGTVTDGMACVDIPESGYEFDGAFVLTIKVYGDSIKKAVAIFDGQIARSISDAIINGDRTIYTSEKILALIEDMEKAEADASAAAEAASTAATSASSAATSATNAAKAANDAATHANAAGDQAVLFGNNANAASQAAMEAARFADQSAQQAIAKAEEAERIAQDLDVAKEGVESAVSQARGAASDANAAATRANSAATAANAAAGRAPYIGENGNWYTWDVDTGAYVDTGVAAGGGVANDSTDLPESGGGGNAGEYVYPVTEDPNMHLVTNENGRMTWEKRLNFVNGQNNGAVRTAGAFAESETMMHGENAFAEGDNSLASGNAAHAEGEYTTASGSASHAEGMDTEASGPYSHAEGCGTKSASSYQHVQGKFNVKDAENRYSHIVGNGKDGLSPSNSHTLDWNGNAWFSGKVFVGGNSMDEGAVELGAGGGGEYTPPDWGSKREDGYLMPETTFSVDPESGSAAYMKTIDAVSGEQYAVKWNGTEYVCTAAEIDMQGLNVIALGNHGVLTGGESTNEPFCILALTQEQADAMRCGALIMSLDGSMSPVVSIYGNMEIVQKIDEKYIPFPAFPTIDLREYGMTEAVSQSSGSKFVQLTETQAHDVDKAFAAGAFWCVTGGIDEINDNSGAKALLTVGIKGVGTQMMASALLAFYGSYTAHLVVKHSEGSNTLTVYVEKTV